MPPEFALTAASFGYADARNAARHFASRAMPSEPGESRAYNV